jgi:hypothetical protein
VAKKKQPSGKPKEAPRAPFSAKVLHAQINDMLLYCKDIALETRASLEQTSKVLEQITDKLTDWRYPTVAQMTRPTPDELQIEQLEIEVLARLDARVKALVKQYLQENPEWLRRADPPEAKMCGARYKGATCELRLGHTEWHGDRTAVKYWPLETSDAPESFPGPKAGQ